MGMQLFNGLKEQVTVSSIDGTKNRLRLSDPLGPKKGRTSKEWKLQDTSWSFKCAIYTLLLSFISLASLFLALSLFPCMFSLLASSKT